MTQDNELGLMVADALVLDNKNQAAEGMEFTDPKHPLHNIAHPTVLILPNNPFGLTIWGMAFTGHRKGHGPLLAQLSPGVCPEPKTLMIPEVTIGSLKDALKIWGPVQEAVGHAIADCVGADGGMPAEVASKHLCLVQVYVDPASFDTEMLWATQYAATKRAFLDAWNRKQTAKWTADNIGKVFHPFGLGSVEAVEAAKKLAGELKQAFIRPAGVTVET